VKRNKVSSEDDILILSNSSWVEMPSISLLSRTSVTDLIRVHGSEFPETEKSARTSTSQVFPETKDSRLMKKPAFKLEIVKMRKIEKNYLYFSFD